MLFVQSSIAFNVKISHRLLDSSTLAPAPLLRSFYTVQLIELIFQPLPNPVLLHREAFPTPTMLLYGTYKKKTAIDLQAQRIFTFLQISHPIPPTLPHFPGYQTN